VHRNKHNFLYFGALKKGAAIPQGRHAGGWVVVVMMKTITAIIAYLPRTADAAACLSS